MFFQITFKNLLQELHFNWILNTKRIPNHVNDNDLVDNGEVKFRLAKYYIFSIFYIYNSTFKHL